MKTFRRHCLKSALPVLACAGGAAAQTAQDFRGRYGPPVSARGEACEGAGVYSATVVWKGRRCARPAGKGTRQRDGAERRPVGR